MILMRDRGAEQREDTVAGRLRHIALVAMHRVHHQLERGIDQPARLLRVEVLDQLHRALYIAEQRGDGLALAVDRPRTIWLLCRDANFRERLLLPPTPWVKRLEHRQPVRPRIRRRSPRRARSKHCIADTGARAEYRISRRICGPPDFPLRTSRSASSFPVLSAPVHH